MFLNLLLHFSVIEMRRREKIGRGEIDQDSTVLHRTVLVSTLLPFSAVVA